VTQAYQLRNDPFAFRSDHAGLGTILG
jgi:hypothetical protein